jgi:hypothetical protein
MISDDPKAKHALSPTPGRRENLPVVSVIDANVDRLWAVAERARARGPLPRTDIAFVRDTLPAALESFPRIRPPKTIHHPGGFTVSGAPVGTFLRSALLLAGQKALGRRFAGHPFYENVERDLALGVMRSHFHHGYPKGTHCCVQCTLAVYPVLEAGAIRFFDCAPLSEQVRQIIRRRQWRFARAVSAAMVRWSVGDGR